MKEPPALYAQGLAPLSVPTHRKWERKLTVPLPGTHGVD